ncbi:septal ring lytic transglycosylase RlpA family protein [Zoogloea sp.]|uniref:septal ring lytic transglycosylase RlpA family protein n=1 Tax=Zoogloea sp. TaxID=49181 RepID=UPI00263830A0|nr:septal ring lytic transglycosylase RlpA family protein [Zoogloea sp.]
MTPVAISRRARLLLAPLCSTLLLVGPVHAAPDSSIEAASDAGPRTGLKAALPARFKGGVFKFDAQSDESSAEADEEAVATPRVDKNDYSLQGSMSSGGGLTLEKGVASWYGKMFHGRKTSSGDPYDMYAMTAAHPTLPIPSYVRVTNLANGRSAVVRVNDRGPFHPGRIIDLSYAAAYKLGYTDQGHARVEVALVLPEEVSLVRPGRPVPPVRRLKAPAAAPVVVAARPAAAPLEVPSRTVVEPVLPQVAAAAPVSRPTEKVAERVADNKAAGEVFLQLGAFATFVTAEQFKGLVEHELKWLKESVSVLASEGKYRLHVGPFASAMEARSIAERIAGTLKLRPFVVQR